MPGNVRVATWNIENWNDHFQSLRDKGLPEPATEEGREQRTQERYQNDEDNWEIAQVLLDPAFAPDVLVFEEGCDQASLDAFADQWLEGTYPTRVVFAGNSDRVQTLGILLRDGFTIVETEDQFYKMPDEGDLNPRSDFLFARGPAFVLVETPDGKRVWVGVTHQKSKGGNSVEVTRWRAAEAKATHDIIRDLAAKGEAGVLLLGDMNDEVGVQEFELEAGGDVIGDLVGTNDDDATNDLVLVTQSLADAGVQTFSGYWRDRYRSFIDHIVATPDLAPQVQVIGVYDTPWARVASDHLPVYVDVKLD